MKTERITIRVNEDLKKELNVLADKYKMNLSQLISKSIKETLESDKLSDSQAEFIRLFETAFKQSYDPFFKQMMVVLNRCDFNTRWSIKQQDIFMGQLKIPQERDQLSLSIIDHPITEVAHEKVQKDIRKMSARKNELDNE